MVSRVREIADKVRARKLRVCHNPVFGKTVEAQQAPPFAVNVCEVQKISERADLIIRQHIARRGKCAQSRRGSNRPTDRTCSEVDPTEELIEQCGISASLCCLKRLQKTILKNIHFVDIDGAQQLRPLRTHISHIECELIRKSALDTKVPVLNVWSSQIILEGARRLGTIRQWDNIQRFAVRCKREPDIR